MLFRSRLGSGSVPGFWSMLRRFWPDIRQYRVLIAGALAALFVEVLLRLLEPWPLKFIFDRVITTTPSGGRSGIDFVDALEPMSLLIWAALAVVIFAGLRALAAYSSVVGFALAGNRVMAKIRSRLFNHMQCLPLAFHTRARSGDLLVRIIGDMGMLQEVTVTAALPLLGNFLILFAMMGVMLWMNWQLALVALAVVPLFWFFTLRLSRRIRDVARKQRRTESAMASTAAEAIGAIKTVQALSLENTFADAFSTQSNKSLKEGVKAKRLAASLERTVDVLVAIATALVLGYGARLVMDNALTPGDLIVFLAYLKNAFKPLRNFAKYTARLAKASAAGERVLDLLDLAPGVQDIPDAIPADKLRGAVRFEAVNFAYDHPDRPNLNGLDFEIHPGQHIALVGSSGAGKSTLVALLLRLYDPTHGRILIDGRDIHTYALASLRSQISVVLQDTLLFATSVRDNIAYGTVDTTEEAVESAARLANAHDFIMALPDGYDTVVGERGVTLSTGQRQRIAVARAAIRDSAILILDEPTASLDKENEREVIAALDVLSSDRSTFIITHNLHWASHADRILFLQNGHLHEQGSHAELMQANGAYAALYRLQDPDRVDRKSYAHLS